MQGHISDEKLTALAEESLTREDALLVNRHLESCQKCRTQAENIEEMRRRLFDSAQTLETPSLDDAVLDRIDQRHQTGDVPIPGWKRAVRVLADFLSSTRARAATATAAVLLIVGYVGLFLYTPSQAWSLDQSIEALEGKRGAHFVGSLTIDGANVSCEMWIRGRDGESRAQDMLLRADNGLTVWVRGNSTYFYTPPDPVVYTDDAQTAGFSHWPGAGFLELLRKVFQKAEIDYRLDVFHARRLVVLKVQFLDAAGAKSLVLEFDTNSKLLVTIKSWNNYDWSGPPVFQADSITYLDSAPDSLFEVKLPDHLVYRERDVSVASEMIGLLSARSSGLSLPGLSEEEASARIASKIYAAVINGDMAGFRALAPVASLWDDDQLKAVLGGVDGQESVIELVEMQEPRRRGSSPLGPLMVVPVVVRHKDGRLYQHKLIVQIRREAGSDFSCVVYGPYGVPYLLE